ncbi:MAG: septation protein IspZ, partial [Methylophilaceae bacterium]
MKFFLDLLPVIVFFTVYKYSDIFLATLWAIIISIFIAAVTFAIKKTIEKMVIVNTLLITFLGGLTILFQDNTFIMWKPTAIYWLIAFTLFGSQIFLRKNLIKKMMSKQFQLSEKRWSFLNTNL